MAGRPRWRRDVTLFLVGQTISMFGTEVVQYAAMWYVTLESGSGTMLMLYSLFAFAPRALVAFFGGGLADRLNRKTVIIVSDAVIALVTAALAVWMLVGTHVMWGVFLAVMVRSIGGGFQLPAVNAVLPQIVPEGALMRVNSVNSTLQAGVLLVAPATAGVVYAAGGIVPTLAVDVVTAVIGIGLFLLVPVATVREGEDKPPFLRDLLDGVRYVATHRTVRWVLVVYAAIFLLTVAPSFLVPLRVTHMYGQSVWRLTALETGFAAGMTVAGAAMALCVANGRRVRMVVVSSLLLGASNIVLGWAPDFWWMCATFVAVGVMEPFFNTPARTLLQEKVDGDFLGRVFSFISILFAVATPLGMVVAGPLADAVSVEVVLVVSGVLTLVVIAAAVASPTGRVLLRKELPAR